MSKEKKIAVAKELEKIIKFAKQNPNITKASTGMGEDTDGAGGYLTRPEILRDILKPDFMEGSIYERCTKIDVSDKANGLFMNVTAQTTRTNAAGILGGFIAYSIDEGVAPTFTKGQFWQDQLDLNQIGVICRVTNALLQDSLVLEQYLSKGLGETIKYYTDYSILYGDGTNGCNGLLDPSGDRVTKYITPSGSVAIGELRAMVGWYYGGSNGCWIMGRDAWLEVLALYTDTLPLVFLSDGSAVLFGYPIIVKDDVKARCIVLGDFTQYLVAQKPIREAVSEDLYFLTNETCFRTIFRLNGMPIWKTPITEESTKVTWPFVALDTQDFGSSSSSSSDSSLSSLSSSSSSLSSLSSASSNSSSSKSLSSASSASLSSDSSASLSSQSLSSDSSDSSSTEVKSSSSSSSLSSESLSSDSSASLSSDSSDSSESSSQSSGMIGPCKESYIASEFATTAINGTYYVAGRYGNKAYYAKADGSKYIFYSTGLNVFAIANTKGASPAQWLSNSVEESGDCPDGAYTTEDGLIS